MKQVTPKDIYLSARELVGTPWLHQGRLKGVGVDCIGLAILVAQDLGLGDFNEADYPRTPDGTMQRRIAEKFPTAFSQPGVLLTFRFSQTEQHCGIVSEYMDGLGLIHAWDVAKQVCEHRLDAYWLDRVTGVFGFPGVNYDD
ncbi:MAG: hypothetical protein AAFQ41_02250 [Cyanobacteria bacterium J06623_7]